MSGTHKQLGQARRRLSNDQLDRFLRNLRCAGSGQLTAGIHSRQAMTPGSARSYLERVPE